MTGLAVAAGIWLLVGSGAVAHRAPAARPLHPQTPALRHQVDRLSVSANRRFLQHADGSPFFWLGDTAWLLFTRLDRAQTTRYLDDRQAKDFTVIQVMVLHEADDRAANGAAALVDGDPARPRTTPGDSPTDPDAYDYWDHVDWVVQQAAARGIYVALVPAWASVVNAGRLNAGNVAAYATFLARRYRGAPNVVWLVGGDAKGGEHLDVWNAMGRTLRAEDSGHLISFHPFGRMQSSTWFHGEAWLDFNMFQSGHRTYEQDTDSPKRFGEDNWRYVLDDYAREPAKPVLDGEPSYENIPQGLHDGTQPVLDGRRRAALCVLVGIRGRLRSHLRQQCGDAVSRARRRQGQLLAAQYVARGAQRPWRRRDASPLRADALATLLRSRIRSISGRGGQRQPPSVRHRHARARLRVHLHLHRSPVRRSPGNTVRKPAQRMVVQPA